LKVTKSDHG